MAKKQREEINNDPVLTQSEVARAVNKHPATISRWIDDGLLAFVRLPSGIRAVRLSELNKFLGGSALPIKEVG